MTTTPDAGEGLTDSSYRTLPKYQASKTGRRMEGRCGLGNRLLRAHSTVKKACSLGLRAFLGFREEPEPWQMPEAP